MDKGVVRQGNGISLRENDSLKASVGKFSRAGTLGGPAAFQRSRIHKVDNSKAQLNLLSTSPKNKNAIQSIADRILKMGSPDSRAAKSELKERIKKLESQNMYLIEMVTDMKNTVDMVLL
jgi:hypothetical protein